MSFVSTLKKNKCVKKNKLKQYFTGNWPERNHYEVIVLPETAFYIGNGLIYLVKSAYGMAAMREMIQTSAMILTARLKPDIVWAYKGWQMARYRSMLNATIVRTDE